MSCPTKKVKQNFTQLLNNNFLEQNVCESPCTDEQCEQAIMEQLNDSSTLKTLTDFCESNNLMSSAMLQLCRKKGLLINTTPAPVWNDELGKCPSEQCNCDAIQMYSCGKDGPVEDSKGKASSASSALCYDCSEKKKCEYLPMTDGTQGSFADMASCKKSACEQQSRAKKRMYIIYGIVAGIVVLGSFVGVAVWAVIKNRKKTPVIRP